MDFRIHKDDLLLLNHIISYIDPELSVKLQLHPYHFGLFDLRIIYSNWSLYPQYTTPEKVF